MDATMDRIRGCLLGGAVGDAMGAPVEFLSLREIHERFGVNGITDFAPAYGRPGAITDDTQMTLFTAEGLLRAAVRRRERGVCDVTTLVRGAYLRWLYTQGHGEPLQEDHGPPDGWLIDQHFLHSRRSPGNTCLSGLLSGRLGTTEDPLNDSKGCGGVMRMAPVGFFAPPQRAFALGCELAAITHGHPSGYIASGFLASVISSLNQETTLVDAVDAAASQLSAWDGHEEVLEAIDRAVTLSNTQTPSAETVERLGAGWVAEEALAISVYCALVGSDFSSALRLAVNHSGDSDSTGAITGNVVGAATGTGGVPDRWLEQLEGRDVIEQLAADIAGYVASGDVSTLADRYPPS